MTIPDKPKVVHCKRESFDVYIGRPSKWGNPFTVQEYGRGNTLAKYKKWIKTQPKLIEEAKIELKGKILGCWCKPRDCHGDILLEIANNGNDE